MSEFDIDGDDRKDYDIIEGQRLARTRVWVDSLDSLRNEISGRPKETVDYTIKFLDEYVYPGIPITDETGEKYGVMRDGDKQAIGLIALFAYDSDLHPFFKECIDRSRFQYSESIQSIIIPPKRLSSRWRGIVLCHELQHARYHLNGIFRGQENAHCLEEQSVYRDEHEIIRTIYGDRYTDFVDETAITLSESLLDEGSLSREQLAVFASRCLSVALDKPKHTFENNLRMGTIMLDLAFTALEHVGRSSPEDFALVTETMESDQKFAIQGVSID